MIEEIKKKSSLNIDLRKYRAVKRLINMFADISAIEENQEKIATYIEVRKYNVNHILNHITLFFLFRCKDLISKYLCLSVHILQLGIEQKRKKKNDLF
jgi:hypothetical protein